MEYILSENLALGKEAFESSAWSRPPSYISIAHLAVDGNPFPDFRSGSCTQTDGDDHYPWWGVDLGDNYLIKHLEIVNREGSFCK